MPTYGRGIIAPGNERKESQAMSRMEEIEQPATDKVKVEFCRGVGDGRWDAEQEQDAKADRDDPAYGAHYWRGYDAGRRSVGQADIPKDVRRCLASLRNPAVR